MTNKTTLMILGSWASVGTAGMLILMKAFAFFITGSVAILASLFDSIQDFLTSGINFFTIRHSLQPADKKHRFGHGKAEGIGSFLQGLILLISAVGLFVKSIINFGTNNPLTHSFWGIGVILITLILTTLLVRFQRFIIHQTNSLSIQVDSAHYTGDLLMNTGVLISLLFSYSLQINWIDCLFGILVSLYLFKSSVFILRQASAMLMDEEMPQHVQTKIRNEILSIKEIKKIKDLRTRLSGCFIFIQATLILDGHMSLSKAHLIADKAENLIHKIYPDSDIIIHLEPS